MMKIHRDGMEFVVAAVMVALLSSAASAGTILTAPAPVASGPGLGLVNVPAIFTPNVNNDNQVGGGGADNNVVIPLKQFAANALIDLVFSLGSSDGGTTEYKVTEFVDNNTGFNWSSYKMQIGTGTGDGFTPFTSGGLDFDAPAFDAPPTSGAFPTVTTGAYELNFSGGNQGTGAQSYVFRLDIPDLTGASPTFTLRQIPTPVPEPSVLVLAGLALLGVALNRRRG